MDASALSMHIADTPEKIGEGSGLRPSFVGFPFPFPIPPEDRRVSARTLTISNLFGLLVFWSAPKPIIAKRVGRCQHMTCLSPYATSCTRLCKFTTGVAGVLTNICFAIGWQQSRFMWKLLTSISLVVFYIALVCDASLYSLCCRICLALF